MGEVEFEECGGEGEDDGEAGDVDENGEEDDDVRFAIHGYAKCFLSASRTLGGTNWEIRSGLCFETALMICELV